LRVTCLGCLHVAGRGLPLKEEALLYLAVSPVPSPAPYSPRDLCLINYLFNYLFSFGRVLLPEACYTLLDAGFPLLDWFYAPIQRDTGSPLCRTYARITRPVRGTLILTGNLSITTFTHKKALWIYPYSGYTHKTLCILYSDSTPAPLLTTWSMLNYLYIYLFSFGCVLLLEACYTLLDAGFPLLDWS